MTRSRPVGSLKGVGMLSLLISSVSRLPASTLRYPLLIGIEYKSGKHDVDALNYILRDLHSFKDYLTKSADWPEGTITLMFEGADDLLEPSRENILTQIRRLVENAQPDDLIVFLYLGHGCQTLNETGTEADRLDENILTSNHAGWPQDKNGGKLPTRRACDLACDHPYYEKYRGVISDNELRELLVNPVPAGAQLLAFIETCHSETMLDSSRWKRKCARALSRIPSAYDQVVRCVRRTNFTRLSSMDYDLIVFLYLGHGCQTLNETGTEADRLDENILTSNHAGWPQDKNGGKLPTRRACDLACDHPYYEKYRGVISDNELRELLVNPVPAGAQLLAFIETCHSETMLDLDSSRWKRKCARALSRIPSAYDQVVRCVRRTNFTRLSSMDCRANPADLIGPPSKIAAQNHAPQRGDSYDDKYFLKSPRGYDLGDPWVVYLSSARDDQTSLSDEWTMMRVVIEHLEAQRNEGRRTTVLELQEHVKDRLAQLRLESIRKNGTVEKGREEALKKSLRKRVTPQVSTLDKKMLHTVLEI
ncbi:uncharacterized protein PHACADRAFT_206615 [Phanerochaete carnosa HHB-10118-sp]|uniref:Peptidase C14 caspase domain-containing protein n=1 Tax=Phanerochaete carnosa (strain HHB-10118-sp) TaxID=650164 RepID=K5W1K7_PHACS|nr:uncharacterized protein PHACADRAFT_206615 [Phanerochaete carnosa HHB-10118-sp]EKM57738.1 hypothetical protein PHACADRAFT_206615 [Phanerochaete carnosa HHB-10118-sp]